MANRTLSEKQNTGHTESKKHNNKSGFQNHGKNNFIKVLGVVVKRGFFKNKFCECENHFAGMWMFLYAFVTACPHKN